METLTFIYPRPGSLDTTEGQVDVDIALALVAYELDLDDFPRTAHTSSVEIPGFGPDETWVAMDELVGRAEQHRLFHCPFT